MNCRRWLGVAAVLVVTMIARTAPATAQVVTSEISGVVSDASGGVMPGATVTGPTSTPVSSG